MKDHNGILLFDGVCNLCNNLVNFIIRIDRKGRIKFAALQSQTGKKLLADAKIPPGDSDTVVYFSHGMVYLRSKAILQLLFDTGGVWRMTCFFKLIPVFLADALYRLIARKRYRIFGKRRECMIPAPGIADRFLG